MCAIGDASDEVRVLGRLNGKEGSRVTPAPKAKTSKAAPKDVDAYIAAAPIAVQPMLSELRQVIKSAAPNAKERISYGMPSYDYHGRIAHFAGYEGHVGLYALPHAAHHHAPTITNYLKT